VTIAAQTHIRAAFVAVGETGEGEADITMSMLYRQGYIRMSIFLRHDALRYDTEPDILSSGVVVCLLCVAPAEGRRWINHLYLIIIISCISPQPLSFPATNRHRPATHTNRSSNPYSESSRHVGDGG
jgi:hypothetical protein